MTGSQSAAGWPTRHLVDCTSDGNISYGIVQPGQHTESGIPIVRVNNFKNGVLDDSDVLRVSKSIEENYRRTRLQGGEVLLTLVGSVGQTAIVSGDLAGWNVARAVAVIRPSGDVSAKWLTICLQSADARHFLDGRANTTVQKTLNLGDVRRVPIPIPPREIRCRIESIIASLDDKIDLNRRINQTLEAMVQAVFKSWFVDFDPVKAKVAATAEGRDPLSGAMSAISGKSVSELDALPTEHYEQLAATAAAFPNMMQELEFGGIPTGWSSVALSDIADVVMGQSPDGETYNEVGDGTALINGPVEFDSYHPKRVKWTTQVTKTSRTDDLIVCVRGSTTGKCVKSDGVYCLGRGVCAIRAREPSWQPFVDQLYKFSLTDLLSLATGSTFPNWSGPTLKSYRVLRPSADLIDAYSRLVQPAISRISSNEVQNKSLTSLRDTLLPKLLSGELSVAEAMAETDA